MSQLWLADQLWVSRRTPEQRHFQQIENDPGMGIKPRGGLWTSTYRPGEDAGSGWVEWCLGEQWGVPSDYRWKAWLFKIPPRMQIYRIDTYEDLRRLVESSFGIGGPGRALHSGGLGIDYAKMARAYDAIHLTENGQWETRLSHPHTLYGWDCESVLWLHWPWAAGEVIDLGWQEWGKPAQPSTRHRLRRARRDL